MGTNDALQHVRTQVDDVDGRRAAQTNLGQQWVPTRFCNAYERRLTMLTAEGSTYECSQRQWRQTRSMYECRTLVCTNEVLQRVRTQVSGVDCLRAARTNVGQQCVPTRFCNVYERR